MNLFLVESIFTEIEILRVKMEIKQSYVESHDWKLLIYIGRNVYNVFLYQVHKQSTPGVGGIAKLKGRHFCKRGYRSGHNLGT